MRLVRLLVLTITTFFCATQAHAQSTLVEAIGRTLGWGWSDGYHAPRPSPLALYCGHPSCAHCAAVTPDWYETTPRPVAVPGRPVPLQPLPAPPVPLPDEANSQGDLTSPHHGPTAVRRLPRFGAVPAPLVRTPE